MGYIRLQHFKHYKGIIFEIVQFSQFSTIRVPGIDHHDAVLSTEGALCAGL